ncbi:hypothetical protein DRA42_03060 [Ethanoligenens harbinense]|nr:hypothetical protein CXQ68_03055 [Ethanoligenens harbinense YUAN-3]AYF37973.1 hypothetical protein CXP51_02920 [Ethanoligenens harbinense]AYF40719.1 hypothetical protein CN246_03055 [Ethanoligenens harbinense]QCN91552.1 hypothetical protein DRA42_03060 [Ethanoligenens harbinense]
MHFVQLALWVPLRDHRLCNAIVYTCNPKSPISAEHAECTTEDKNSARYKTGRKNLAAHFPCFMGKRIDPNRPLLISKTRSLL